MSNQRAGGLVERESETAHLRAVLDDARAGAGRMVLVEGAAGIGKTGLLKCTRGLADDAGLRVLAARATEFERAFAFGVVRQLFEPRVRGAARETVFAGAAGEAAAVLGGATDDGAAPTDPGFDKLNGLYWLLANLADDEPVAVLVDDLQWSDLASQRFLRFLQPRLDGMRVAVVAAGRPAGSATDQDALAELSADPAATVIRPSPLTATGVAAIVRSRLNPAAEGTFCAACHRACGGNPFLLGELLTELRGAGCRGSDRDVALVEDIAPSSVQRSVSTRIERLGPEAGALARAVAVLGDGAEPEHVATLAGIDDEAAGLAADALAAAGVVEPGSRLRFAHPLVRNAVHASVAPGELDRAHQDAARLLRTVGSDDERVALHLLEVRAGLDAESTAVLVDAAEGALARGAPEASVAYLRRALVERGVDDATRRTAMDLLVSAACRTMDARAFDGIGDDPIGEIRDRAAIELQHQLAIWLWAAGRIDEALDLIDVAIGRADAAGDLAEALRLEALLTLYGVVQVDEGRRRLDRWAGRVVPRSEEDRLVQALRAHFSALTGTSASDTAAEARRALKDGLIFAENPESNAPSQAIRAQLFAEDLDGADEAIDHWLRDLRGRGSAFMTNVSHIHRGRVLHLRGEIALAEAGLREPIDLLFKSGAGALAGAFVGAWLIDTLVEREELDVAEEFLRLAVENAPPIAAATHVTARGVWTLGQLRLAQGRNAEALDHFMAVRAYVESSGEQNPAVLPWASAGAPALAAVGRGEEAKALVEDEIVRARRWGAPGPVGIALRALSRLETGERRMELIRESVAVLERSPVRIEYWRSLCDLGSALRHERQPAAAREPLRMVVAEAARAGATATARRAQEELAATGETVPAAGPAGIGSLTPSERRIAGMAAGGMSNRAIAQELFVSVKTVETHLSAVYRKLEVPGRAQLAAALAAA